MSTSSGTLKQKAYHEMKEFLVIALYLWIVLGIFLVYKSVILSRDYFDITSHGFAIINALALAKVILVAKELHLDERLRLRPKNVPLIYTTLINAAIFAVLLAIFKILEEGAVGVFQAKSLAQAMPEPGGFTWAGLLTLTIMMFIVLIPFCACIELGALLGDGKLDKVFFRRCYSLSQLSSSTRAGVAEELKHS